MNKKRKILIVVIILIVICMGVFFGYYYFNRNLISDIKLHYNERVLTNKKASIYDQSKKKVGTVSKDFYFELENVKKININDKYFKVKDNDYYLYYKDVKKDNNSLNNKNSANYLLLGKKIKTDKKTVFYLDGKKVLTINKGLDLDIIYMDENYNYVKYLNRILGVKKHENENIIDGKEEGINASFISIINYNKIDKECSDDNCIKEDTFKEELNYLNENGYYTITFDEYMKWHNGELRLKEKAVMLIINEESESSNNLKKEYSVNIEFIKDKKEVKLSSDNKTTNKESNLKALPKYNVTQKTTIDKFIQMINGENVIYDVNNNNQSIAVINYHFFYDPDLGENCDENICLGVKAFKQQLDYLKENNFKTLTMDEFRAWMYGEIELPEKSVLLTIDDGACGTGKHNGNKLIPILEEYNMHATLFLITGWWDVENYRSPNLDIQSHTFDMHNSGRCGGAQVICANHDELLTDLQKSLEIVDDNDSFCFPFYSYDAKSIEVVKEAGFKLAFIGGFRKAKRSDDKFMVPRYPIYKTTSLQSFINMVN